MITATLGGHIHLGVYARICEGLMNWPKIARCTAAAIGITFLVAAIVVLAVRIF
jgi:hypothetical protein